MTWATDSSRSLNSMRLTVVGNPENRRVTMFAAAVAAAGWPAIEVVPWRQVASGAPVRFAPGATVRIDSPGENREVDRLLRGVTAAHGEIVGAMRWYDGLRAALRRLDAAAAAA